MTHTEQPRDDAAVTRELRDSLAGIDAPARPSLEAIAARGRARQRRRVTGLAGLGSACAAAAAVAAVGLTGSASPSGNAGSGGTVGTVQTAAFTLTHNANGTDTLRLSMKQMFDPAELQRALARDGIPALVKTGVYCESTPRLPSPVALGVLRIERPNGTPVGPPAPPGRPGPHQVRIPPGAVNVINPARMPAGSELFFDYASHGLAGGLINPHSYNCHAGSSPFTQSSR